MDVNPGDRQAVCLGLMEPIGVEVSKGKYVLTHKCTKCGFQKKNKTSESDNFDVLVKLSPRPIRA